MTTTEKLDLAYLKFKTALHLYQKSPTDLDSDQLAEVENAVQEEYDLFAQMLASGDVTAIPIATDQVESLVADLQRHYSNEQEFQEQLTKQGLSLPDLQTAITRQLQAEGLQTETQGQTTPVNPTEATEAVAQVQTAPIETTTPTPVQTAPATPISEIDAKIYYYMHLDQFDLPETRTTRHILISINPSNPENTRRAARKRLFNVAVRIRRKPQSFSEQARKHSESGTAAQGGFLGRIPRGTLAAELDEVLFSLQEQEVSKIVETADGFHLLLCEQIHPPGQLSFEEAQPSILERLQQRHQELGQKTAGLGNSGG